MEIHSVVVHVDDFLVISSTNDVESKFFRYLDDNFKSVKKFTDDITFLNIKIERDFENHKILLSQRSYAQSIIDEFLSPTATVSKYPLSGNDLTAGEVGVYPEARVMIGKIRYLVDRTRPDLFYCVGYLSKFVSKASDEVMREIIRVIRYIKYTIDYKLIIGSVNSIKLFAMSDASFVQSGDFKSQLGYAVYLGEDSGSVSNRSAANTCINISSTHAECDGLIEAIKEILWFQGLLCSLGYDINDPTIIHVDNKPVVTLAGEGNHLKRSRHFVTKSAYIKELVKNGVLSIQHISGVDNHADLHTKPLFGAALHYHTIGVLGKQ